MSSRARLILALLTGLILGASFSLAGRVLAARAPAPTEGAPRSRAPLAALPWEDAKLLAEVLQRVREKYVDAVDDHTLLQNAARGMVEALDEHSAFLDRDEFEDMTVSTSGAYAGIGVEVAPGKDGVSVVRRMPGSPAEAAGILAGDVIVSIDAVAVDPGNPDAAIARMRGREGSTIRLAVAVDPGNPDAAIARMRGQEGSTIRLAVRRAGVADALEFKVERAIVELQSVAAELIAPDYGYLRVSSFSDTTPQEIEQAVDRFERARHDSLKGIVIDLRNNPGGVLDAAVQIADDFLDSGIIVSAEGRSTEARFRMQAKPGDISNGAKLAVLVNGGSASASEILAAALHDNGRATLIGRRTYGKGTVQTIMPLSNGQALKLTTSRYFTPAGVSINGAGILPDVLLDGPEQPPAELDAATANPTLATRDAQVSRALQALQSRNGMVARHVTLPVR